MVKRMFKSKTPAQRLCETESKGVGISRRNGERPQYPDNKEWLELFGHGNQNKGRDWNVFRRFKDQLDV